MGFAVEPGFEFWLWHSSPLSLRFRVLKERYIHPTLAGLSRGVSEGLMRSVRHEACAQLMWKKCWVLLPSRRPSRLTR